MVNTTIWQEQRNFSDLKRHLQQQDATTARLDLTQCIQLSTKSSPYPDIIVGKGSLEFLDFKLILPLAKVTIEILQQVMLALLVFWRNTGSVCLHSD